MVNKNTKRESKEIYISTDIEMNGPIPGEYSMLSLGAVAFSPTGKILGRFYEKLKPLTGAKEHPDVMSFWGENPLAYKEATSNQKSPEKVMESYVYWVEKLSQKHKSFPIFLGWPLTLDYLFTYWYMVKFVKRLQKLHPFEIPFSFNKAIDVNSFVMAHLKKSYLRSTKIKSINEKWFEGISNNSHKAVEDALNQGRVFMRILKENQEKTR